MKKNFKILSFVTTSLLAAGIAFSVPASLASADPVDGGTYSGDVTVKLASGTNDGSFQLYIKVANEGTLPKTWDNAYTGSITRNGQAITNYELKFVADGGATFFFWDHSCTSFYTDSYSYVFNGQFSSTAGYTCVLDNLSFEVKCITPDLNYATTLNETDGNLYFSLPANDLPFDNWNYKMFPSYADTLKSTVNGVTTNVAIKASGNGEKTGSVVKYGATSYFVSYGGAAENQMLTFGKPELYLLGNKIYSLNLSGLSFIRKKDLSDNIKWRRVTTIESVELTNDCEVAIKYSGVGNFADANKNNWAWYAAQSGLVFDYIYINNDPTYTFADPRIGFVHEDSGNKYCNMQGKADGKLYMHQFAGTVPMFTSGFFAITFKAGILLPTTYASTSSYSKNYATIIKDITFGMISGRKMVDATPVQAFVEQYMAMGSDTPNQCLTLYGPAKTAYNALTADQKALFVQNEMFTAAKNRLQAWATANGDTINASNSLSTATIPNVFNSTQTLSATILIIVLVTGITFCLTLFIKKKKENR